MARPSQFRAKRTYDVRMRSKANKNLEIMAVVGNGDGATFQVAGRDSFYWIRLVNDDNRLTQCFCDICALSYGDLIYVARAKDEKLSYYEFTRYVQNADGDTTAPPVCPKFAQVVYVSENSCQFTTVGAAVTYINALVTGPAAGRLFLIKCQAGNFGEAGDVTIPQYVHLEGVGEASELEMGANTLILSSDTSVSNIVVESSDPADAIRCNGVSNVVLRNVRGIQGAAADVFHIYGASTSIELYNCIAGATAANAVGFHVGNTAVVYMDDCKAEDATNFADALLLDAAMCTVVTRWCTFIGNGDDVQTGANSAWYHLDCYFYETNSTLAAATHYALPTKRFNQTLIVAEQGGDFQALSEAITYINAQGDAAAAKLYGILVLHGNFAEAGDITIPQYVHVFGMGEGSRIETGANDILMTNSDASLADVVVVTTSSYAVNITASVTLRNVRAEVSGTALAGFRVGGGSPKFYDCIVDPGDATTSGFTMGGSGTILLDHCIASDSALFTNALNVTGTATVITRYCCFAGSSNDVNQVGGTTWQHFDDQIDPVNITLGGTHTAMPGKRFNQTVIVAEEGGDFQTVGDAVGWISAQGDAATDKRYGILVLAGNFAEGADLTIPQWVTVAGMGECSRIEMVTKMLIMSDDSCLQDVVVTTSDSTGIRTDNADCVLFNVKLIMGFQPSQGIDIGGDSAAELYHVVVEYTVGGTTTAFAVSDTATPLLVDCKADDSTNISNALNISNSACTVTTQSCIFHGSGNDVSVGAAATWNSYKDQVDPLNCTISGTVVMQDLNAGDSFAFVVENTSGAAAAAGDVGYIDEAGEYQTTTTQYNDVSWCVVVVPGANNADIWVARRGRVTVQLDANCSIGDFLYTSGTATQATPQSYTRPELFAVALTANAAGAGGTCRALLLCHTKFVSMTSSVFLQYVSLADASDYRATIAGLPGGAVVNMNAPISGNINTIDPQGANYLAKFRIYNETRGDYALLDDVTGAAQLTLTAAVPGTWQVGDTLTARSQTCVNPAAPPYFYDLDLSSADNTVVPVLARALVIGDVGISDTGAGNITHWVHPWTAYAGSRLSSIRNQVANFWNFRFVAVPLYQRRYCVYANASGAGTVRWQHNLGGWWEAAP